MENDRIAALATPMGSSALAVIRTSGPGCIDEIAGCTDRQAVIAESRGGRMRKVRFVDPTDGGEVDEVVLGIFRGPASYTGEDMVEIYSHGSIPGIQRILATLYTVGFRPAEPGEFTQRAFLAGKIDLTRAEAVQELVSSQTATGHEMALQRLGGSVEAVIRSIKDEIVQIMARVAVQIDYPEDEIGEIAIDPVTVSSARDRLFRLAESYRTGRLYQEGVSIALAGKTNAGKSSLFNALLREDRAIVSETHGTTRDYISSRIDLQGIPVELYDTAGLRNTTEAIEEEGIRRTRTVVTGTDVVLYLIDGTVGMTAEDEEVLAELAGAPAVSDRGNRETPPGNVSDGDTRTWDDRRGDTQSGTIPNRNFPNPGRRIHIVWTKSDAPGWRPPSGNNESTESDKDGTLWKDSSRESDPPSLPFLYIPVSAEKMVGIDTLIATILETIVPERSVRTGAAVIDSLRQKNLLDRTIAALDEVLRGLETRMPVDVISVDLQDALYALGEIVGEVTTEEVLDAVFGGFCVGK